RLEGGGWPLRRNERGARGPSFRLRQGFSGQVETPADASVGRLLRTRASCESRLRRGRIVPVLDQVLFLLLVARRQLEQARRGGAENVVFGLLGQERQVVDRARQVEVPVRIVGGVEQPVLRVHHAEGALHRLAVLDLHRLRRVVHVPHVPPPLLLQRRALGRAPHGLV